MATPISIRLPRSLGTIQFDAVVEEQHTDDMLITEHPVEVGSTITDHAYRLPAQLNLTAVTALGSPKNATHDAAFLSQLYQKLLTLQASVTVLPVQTGKRFYPNMLIKSLRVDTDKRTENMLSLQIALQELLFASATVVTVTPMSNQANPQKTAGVVNQGSVNTQPAPNFNPTFHPPL